MTVETLQPDDTFTPNHVLGTQSITPAVDPQTKISLDENQPTNLPSKYLLSFNRLKALGSVLSDPADRIEAASHLYEIACQLGATRTRTELIGFLAELVDGYPYYPLLPPIFVEEGGTVPSIDLEAIENGTIPAPFDIRRRPITATLCNNPDARLYLLKAVIGVSESDWVHEIIAKELVRFVPKLVEPLKSINLVGVLRCLAASADVGVRNQAVDSLLKILYHFDEAALLESGCIDLFLGMATAECPYKKSSVLRLLPLILEKLVVSSTNGTKTVPQNCSRDLGPLRFEIVRLFFEIPLNSKSSVSRKVFVDTLPKMMAIISAVAPDVLFNPIQRTPDDTAMTSAQTSNVNYFEKCLFDITDALLEDQTAEIRSFALTIISLIAYYRYSPILAHKESDLSQTHCLNALKKYIAHLITESQSSNAGTGRKFKLDPHQASNARKCPTCQFVWPTCANLAGMFSFKSDPIFNAIVLFETERNRIRNVPIDKIMLNQDTETSTIEMYREFVQNHLRQYFIRILNDDWIVRSRLVESIPTVVDLFLVNLSPEDCFMFVDTVWLNALLEEANLDIRISTFKRFPLHAWMMMKSKIQDVYNKEVERIKGNEFSTEEDPSCTQRKTSSLINRIITAINGAVNDSDVRVRLVAAEITAHFYLVFEQTHIMAKHLVSPVLKLLRDTSFMVIMSTIGTFHVLKSTNIKPSVDALPFDGKESGVIEAAQNFLALMEDALVRTLNTCLSATLMSQPSPEIPPTPIPMWRLRCAGLHFIPDLNDIFKFTSMEKYNKNDDKSHIYSTLLNSMRDCLQDSVSSVRHCAADAVIRLNSQSNSSDFSHLLLSPILLKNPYQAPLSSRLRFPTLGKALARILNEPDHKGNKITLQCIGGWPIDLYEDFEQILKQLTSDKVPNIRSLTNEALASLTEIVHR